MAKKVDDKKAVAKKPVVTDTKKKPDCKAAADGKLPKGCPIDEAAAKKAPKATVEETAAN